MRIGQAVGRHAKHVAWRKVDDEVVILDLETSVYYSLNETGSKIWELIGKGLSEEAIAEEVAEDYGQKVATVKKDVSAIIKKMKKENLVTPGK
ncbi:MAG TPA: PqqD family protein [Elusimicrobiota bacterium]|nr:PqqD family protein [Elusimicrobiota bacterium]